MAGALAVAALNAVSGLIGAWAWYRGDLAAGASTDHSAAGGLVRAFWVLLRVGQGSALMLAIAVGSLAAAGNYSTEHLFYLYALLPLAIAFVAEQLRVASAQTILDHRGLADAAAVGALPESEQQVVMAARPKREASRSGRHYDLRYLVDSVMFVLGTFSAFSPEYFARKFATA